MKIVADQDIPYLTQFFQADELTLLPGRAIGEAALQNADVLLVRSITQVNETLLKNTQVKWVGSLTAGLDHLDTAWLDAHDIAYRACAGFNAPPVADYVVSVLAALYNREHWQPTTKRAAVIGVGQVGSLVVERLKTLQWDVIEVDPFRLENEITF